MKHSLLLSALSVLLFSAVLTAQVNIIPRPSQVILSAAKGSFTIGPSTQLIAGSELKAQAAFLNNYLQRFYGFQLQRSAKAGAANSITLDLQPGKDSIEGAYTLTVNKAGVTIKGFNGPGAFYGVQSLIQLLPVPDSATVVEKNKLPVPFLTINDRPRFAYRGMHLDVGRHFFPVEFVKEYIDYLALHKMNYFHWHLTEDQGWRIEIKKYPRLTSVGGFRNGTITGHNPGTGNDNTPHGGFYTQDQVREIVQYAAERFITVLPEIEMPGHGSAAIAAYPFLSCFPDSSTKISPKTAWNGPRDGKQVIQSWGVFEDVFCAGKDSTFLFLQDVLDEVIPLFPCQYVHIGGDECPKTSWQRCPACQKRMKDLGLKDEHELQSYFIQRMEKYINGKGKKIIGWDEILEGGLAANATVMSWRGEKGGIEAAHQDHNVIMTPGDYVYFDKAQSGHEDSLTIGGFVPLQKVYSYEPVPKELSDAEAVHVLGAQANVWSEYMASSAKVEYMIFPRISALSEVLWSPKDQRDWNSFEPRLRQQFSRYDLWKVNYSRAFFDPTSTQPPAKKKP